MKGEGDGIKTWHIVLAIILVALFLLVVANLITIKDGALVVDFGGILTKFGIGG